MELFNRLFKKQNIETKTNIEPEDRRITKDDLFRSKDNVLFENSTFDDLVFEVLGQAQQGNSIVIFDTSITSLLATQDDLKKYGYNIKVVSNNNTKFGQLFNPFGYIDNPESAKRLAKLFAKHMIVDGGNEPFLVDAAIGLYSAICLYLSKYAPKENRNIHTFYDLICGYDDDYAISNLEAIFTNISAAHPDCPSYKNYVDYALAPERVKKKIINATRAAKDNHLYHFSNFDTLNAKDIANEKTAIFVIINTCDETFEVLFNLLYSELYQEARICVHDNKTVTRHIHFVANVKETSLFDMTDITNGCLWYRTYNIGTAFFSTDRDKENDRVKNSLDEIRENVYWISDKNGITNNFKKIK